MPAGPLPARRADADPHFVPAGKQTPLFSSSSTHYTAGRWRSNRKGGCCLTYRSSCQRPSSARTCASWLRVRATCSGCSCTVPLVLLLAKMAGDAAFNFWHCFCLHDPLFLARMHGKMQIAAWRMCCESFGKTTRNTST